MKRIDLIWLNGSGTVPDWNLGNVLDVSPAVVSLRESVAKHLQNCKDNLLLFWDSRLPVPDPSIISGFESMRGDVWHAGLRLGLAGQPSLIHSVESIWLLNCDPDSKIDATSWRLSLRAALIPSDVLQKLDFIRPEFEGLDAASLELGHRMITHGVLVRHAPDLIPGAFQILQPEISLEDEIRFIAARYGSVWAQWAVFRAVLNRKTALRSGWKGLRKISPSNSFKGSPYRTKVDEGEQEIYGATVSVVIPTLNRYQYLHRLLMQIRNQTVKPLEILVIDQTESERRDHSLMSDYKDLPLQVFYRDEAGQCSARNAALQIASGEYILFLDDDSEIPEDLIENHLKSLHFFRADASSGVAEETGAGPIPENFRLIRASDVFPTNNTMIHNSVLQRSGLFDLAYDRGQRADGDLGMRVYLSGALMVLNPGIQILHHHAPQGGLRTHNARKITYASSRSSLWQRQLPSATEIYLAQRYFSPEVLREMLWLRVAGTFRSLNSFPERIAKCFISGILLPHTLFKVRQRIKEAAAMAKRFPVIPFPDGQRTIV